MPAPVCPHCMCPSRRIALRKLFNCAGVPERAVFVRPPSLLPQHVHTSSQRLYYSLTVECCAAPLIHKNPLSFTPNPAHKMSGRESDGMMGGRWASLWLEGAFYRRHGLYFTHTLAKNTQRGRVVLGNRDWRAGGWNRSQAMCSICTRTTHMKRTGAVNCIIKCALHVGNIVVLTTLAAVARTRN